MQATALETSAASLQAFLLSLSVVVCPVLEACVDGKRQPPRAWFAAGLSALGVACMELDGVSDVLAGGVSQGDILGLLQPLFFGVGFWECERAMTRHQSRTGDPDIGTPIALTTWQMLAVLGLSIGWMLSADQAGASALVQCVAAVTSDPTSYAALIGTVLWTGLATTAGCALVEAAALGEIASSEATVVFATEPLWGALFANVLLGEVMGPQCQMGGAIMVLACIVSGVGDSAQTSIARVDSAMDVPSKALMEGLYTPADFE